MRMRKDIHKESKAPILDDLLHDDRLARLFSKDAGHCALQLWILQVQSGQSNENRLIYGRLLPYSYSCDRWSAPADDNFNSFAAEVKAQLIRLNLYVQSCHCADLLRQLSIGKTICEISRNLHLELPESLSKRFGATALLATNDLVYRPVAYQLNRDAYDRHSPSSPHGGGGAFSASITQSDKKTLFRLGQDYSVALTESVIKQINADTGLDFGGIDTVRFGDIELLVFPALDDQERSLLSVSWANDSLALVVRFNSQQVPYFSAFQFRLCIMNDAQVIYSGIATSERDAEGVFECKFELSNQLRSMADSTELEVFGFRDEHSLEGALCCRWRIGYVREIDIQGHMVGHCSSRVGFDWLEKTLRPSASAGVKEALTINRGNPGFTNHVGKRETDPWVQANRDVVSLFARLHPPKSDGQFFRRWGKGDPEGRLKFTKWFRALLTKYQQHQVVIFDPYFEDAGLGLLLICAPDKADFIVFRSLPKQPLTSEAISSEPDKPAPRGVDNLLANCEHNRHLLKRIKLRILGLKAGRLHDRYILIVGADSLPIAGFNLSNSFQSAAESFPLLVTPIPSDVLLQVEQYKSELLKEAEGKLSEVETGNSAIQLLFDSTESQSVLRHYEPLSFLEKSRAGDVLSVWTGISSLKGLSGEMLRELLVAMSMLKDNSLALPDMLGWRNCLDQQAGDFSDFMATWELLGEVLAHSRMENNHFRWIESEQGFLEFLVEFLKKSFKRVHNKLDRELAVVDARLFREPVEALLSSSYCPDYLFHPTKYTALTWSEYFAIKFLWWYAPNALLEITEESMSNMPEEFQGDDVVRSSLLSQIFSEIALSVLSDINEVQRSILVHSRKGLLKWMGLNVIEMQLEKPEGLTAVLELVATLSSPDQVQALGWMVNHAAGNPNKSEIYNGLVAALHGALPQTIPADELKRLVDSMRGHMRQLAWTEPWLFREVINPLLKNNRANYDDACEIWVQELDDLLEGKLNSTPLQFDQAREGEMTKVVAFLFASSSPDRQKASLTSIHAILKKQKNFILQPLAGTSNWTRWNEALVVSMWILGFTRWSQYNLRECGIVEPQLENLSLDARKLAMVRPLVEWRSNPFAPYCELAAFFEQVEGLLA